MRELKFRLWDQTKSEFVKNPTIYNRMAIGCDGGVYHGGYDDVINDRYIIEQYTGSKDKNGKEIYEGDILFTDFGRSSFKGVVCYRNCKFLLEVNSVEAFRSIYPNIGEIVGNIHENPDLVKD